MHPNVVLQHFRSLCGRAAVATPDPGLLAPLVTPRPYQVSSLRTLFEETAFIHHGWALGHGELSRNSAVVRSAAGVQQSETRV